MSKSLKVLTYIAITIFAISCSEPEPKLTKLEQGIYDIDDLKTLIPSDVAIIDIDDDKFIKIDNLKRTGDQYETIKISSANNNVAIAFPEFLNKVDESEVYVGKIEVYEFNKSKNIFSLQQTILPTYPRNPSYLEDGQEINTDMRTLSYEIKLYNNKLLVDAGFCTSHKNIPGFDGLDRKEALNKIKNMDIFSDHVFLYEKYDNNWSLNQVFNADFGNDYTEVRLSDNKVRITNPFFGSSLDINDNNCLIFQEQITEALYLYKRDSNGIFKEISKYPIKRAVEVKTSMSDKHSIFTQGHTFNNTVKIINNDTGDIEATLRSPINSINQHIGEAVAITKDVAFISEAVKDRTANYNDAEDRSKYFPGFVHTFKREADGTWALKQTIKSPFNIHYERFGNNIIANEKYLLVASQPLYQRDGNRKSQPGLFYIYRKQEDSLFKLEKVLIGYPESTKENKFISYTNISFFQNGLLFSVNSDSIRYIPDLF